MVCMHRVMYICRTYVKKCFIIYFCSTALGRLHVFSYLYLSKVVILMWNISDLSCLQVLTVVSKAIVDYFLRARTWPFVSPTRLFVVFLSFLNVAVWHPFRANENWVARTCWQWNEYSTVSEILYTKKELMGSLLSCATSHAFYIS